MVLRHADTGEERRFSLTGDANVPIGTYVSTLQRQDGQVIRRQEVQVKSRVEHANVSPAKWGGAAASESFADRVPRSGDGLIPAVRNPGRARRRSRLERLAVHHRGGPRHRLERGILEDCQPVPHRGLLAGGPGCLSDLRAGGLRHRRCAAAVGH